MTCSNHTRSVTRRRALVALGAVGSTVLAGCLGTGSTAGDSQEAELVENMGILEIEIGADSVSPDRIRVAADASVTVRVRNESDERHVATSRDDGFPELDVDAETMASEVWEVPGEPQDVQVRCTNHDETLTDVEVEPMDLGAGCPSG